MEQLNYGKTDFLSVEEIKKEVVKYYSPNSKELYSILDVKNDLEEVTGCLIKPMLLGRALSQLNFKRRIYKKDGKSTRCVHLKVI